MKVLYGDGIDDMFYKYVKYTPDAKEPVSKLIYKNNIERFMKKLNELESEYGLSIISDYSIDLDNMIEDRLMLYDEKYGYVGEVFEVFEEDIEG